uniref:Uncharacterized protein n=1 Tax=Gopherus evgoodei TaxID=1825980 RepID=A0A8C4VF75_9SAUR
MLWSPKFSLSNMRVRLTAKGLLRNLQLPSGYRKSIVIFHTVERGKQKTPKSSCIHTPTSPAVHSTETKTRELAQYKAKCENQSEIILHLKKFLAKLWHQWACHGSYERCFFVCLFVFLNCLSSGIFHYKLSTGIDVPIGTFQ